jgi:hypothetical protein
VENWVRSLIARAADYGKVVVVDTGRLYLGFPSGSSGLFAGRPFNAHPRVNVFTGYYTFKECPGILNPTIGIELGETYIIDQSDRSNWYHPMGFAYSPDGVHNGKVEHMTMQTNSECMATFSCLAPKYLLNGAFLGVNGTADFGLKVYKPSFQQGIVDWTSAGNYSVELMFDDEAYTKDIFYFCHVSAIARIVGRRSMPC